MRKQRAFAGILALDAIDLDEAAHLVDIGQETGTWVRGSIWATSAPASR